MWIFFYLSDYKCSDTKITICVNMIAIKTNIFSTYLLQIV